MHPLDTLDRRRMLQDDEGLGYCNVTKCCTEVCAAGIHITDNAIIAMKERVIDLRYDPVFLGLRIGRRPDREPVGPVAAPGPSPIKRPPPASEVANSQADSHLVPMPVEQRPRPEPPATRPVLSERWLHALSLGVAAGGAVVLTWAVVRARRWR
jgi:hypothetical protein